MLKEFFKVRKASRGGPRFNVTQSFVTNFFTFMELRLFPNSITMRVILLA